MSTMLLMVRREFWEHRSLWIAPLVWAGIIIVLTAWVFLFLIPKHAPAGVLEATHVEEMHGLNADDRKELSQAIETGKAPSRNVRSLFVPRHFAADLDFHQHRGVLYLMIVVQRTRDRSILSGNRAAIQHTDRPAGSGCAGRGTSWSTRAGRRTQLVLFSIFWLRFHAFCETSWRLNFVGWFLPWSSNSYPVVRASSGTHPSLPTS
jgi:hypothetical protein